MGQVFPGCRQRDSDVGLNLKGVVVFNPASRTRPYGEAVLNFASGSEALIFRGGVLYDWRLGPRRVGPRRVGRRGRTRDRASRSDYGPRSQSTVRRTPSAKDTVDS